MEVPEQDVEIPASDVTTGYQIVTATGSSGTVTASAPAGTSVVGGGFTFSNSESFFLDSGTNYLYLQTNGPASDGSAWIVSGRFQGTITVYAICMAV